MPDSKAAENPIVLVYAEPLLAPSMTFIRSQAEALTCFCPRYIGPHYQPNGLQLPKEKVVVMHSGDGFFSRLKEVPFKAFGVAPIFKRRLTRLRPALLHAHFGPMGLRALPLARKLGIPLVVTFHGFDATVRDEYAQQSRHYSHRNYIRRRRELEHGASLLIAVSHFIRSELVRQGYDDKKIAVHYIGVDTELFRPDPCVEREPIALFVGRLAEKKGCEYVIRAMADAQRRFPSAELVVIGDGPLRASLELLAGQILRRYRFLGYRSPAEVRQWMNRARVFAAPSIRARSGDAEGYPIAFAEAQSMELPVATFDSDGVREAVVDGETGLLAPGRNIEALARNLQTLLSNEDLCVRMGQAGRRHVCAEFNLRSQIKKLEDLYRRVLQIAGNGSQLA